MPRRSWWRAPKPRETAAGQNVFNFPMQTILLDNVNGLLWTVKEATVEKVVRFGATKEQKCCKRKHTWPETIKAQQGNLRTCSHYIFQTNSTYVQTFPAHFTTSLCLYEDKLSSPPCPCSPGPPCTVCRAAWSPTCSAAAPAAKDPAARRLGSNRPSRPAGYLNFPCGEKQSHQAGRKCHFPHQCLHHTVNVT